MSGRTRVSIVDDDESIRESLPHLLRELGYAAHTFASAEAFLASDDLRHTDCLVLDVAMPGMTGVDLLRALARCGHRIPIVFITAHRDEWLRPPLIADGAVACLFKPFSESALVEALEMALRAP